MTTSETEAPTLDYASPTSPYANTWLTPRRASMLLLLVALSLLMTDVFVLSAPQDWPIHRWLPASHVLIFELFHFIPWAAGFLLASTFVRFGPFRPAGIALRVARGVAAAIVIVHVLTPDLRFSNVLFGPR